jgi:hypothetical protein
VKRDRTGEVLDDDDDAAGAVVTHRCEDGWAGNDSAGRPSPCRICRPHLRRAGVLVVVPRAAQLSERDWQQRVVDLAQIRGWRWHHTYNSQRSTPGWPDLAMTRRGRFVVAELKTAKGRVTVEQRQWLDALAACPGLEVHTWRPSDWPTVLEVLR